MTKIGIQGGKGSYHEAATRHTFGTEADIAYLHTFHEVFESLQTGQIDQAIVAIANNNIGFIHEPYVLLTSIKVSDYWIVGEIYERIEHQLLTVPGASHETIREIYSQAPALSQCSDYLERTFPNAKLIEQEDTARSAEYVSALGDTSKAAIASKEAGELNRLEILDANIQNDPDNITRFVVIEKRPSAQSALSNNKCSAILQTGQQSGSLLKALQIFYDFGVNISTLHSAFIPNSAFEMKFLVEFEASPIHLAEIAVKLAQRECQLEYIGNYSAVPISSIANHKSGSTL